MGAWGSGLYSDDTTCEARDSYVARLRAGVGDVDALRQTRRELAVEPRDRQVDDLVCLALAETAWRHGRLPASWLRRVLAYLDRGGDAAAWERDAPELAGGRRAVLRRLREKLATPQPPRRELRPARPKREEAWPPAPPIGSVFMFPMGDGTRVPFVLAKVAIFIRAPELVFHVARWRGRGRPRLKTLARALAEPLHVTNGLGGRTIQFLFMEPEPPCRPAPELEETGLVVEVVPEPWSSGFSWHGPKSFRELLRSELPLRRRVGRPRA